ncbi:MAG TPA: DUF4058 family protein [Pirellulales bacterium]|nr:DUF4058 family protein [Pirellulales bacterium]
MPLRDHFRPPLAKRKSWEGFHGQWPATIVENLNANLPPEYEAEPRVHLGSAFEIDVAAYEGDPDESWSSAATPQSGSKVTATWSPGRPALLLEAEAPTPSEYEVLVYDVALQRRLVAAIEIVSPGNKDRPENRRAFVHKCAALLHQGVCLALVDLVTVRTANLYRELAELIGAAERAAVRTSIYAVACRGLRGGDRWRVEAWEHELALGQPLPTLPLWLTDEMFIPLELETSYEESCRALRIR